MGLQHSDAEALPPAAHSRGPPGSGGHEISFEITHFGVLMSLSVAIWPDLHHLSTDSLCEKFGSPREGPSVVQSAAHSRGPPGSGEGKSVGLRVATLGSVQLRKTVKLLLGVVQVWVLVM